MRRERGQALLMTTAALFLIGGMMGLVVDLGWSYYVKKTAQAAADAAAMAAVSEALERAGQEGPFACGADLACQAETACVYPLPSSPSSVIDNACLYAGRLGFQSHGRGRVTVTSGTPPVPTVPNLTADYWVTVRAGETVPQLFSALLGNTSMTVFARATAALVDAPVSGSLILINRQNEQGPGGRGVLLSGNGGSIVTGREGILIASTAQPAASIQGSVAVTAPFTHVRGSGSISLGGQASWTTAPENGYPDSAEFKDPMRGKGQPPAPTGLPDHPVLGGTIAGSADPGSPTVLPPGNYYATRVDSHGQVIATGAPIVITGNVRFTSGTPFGDYVFFGGVAFPSTHTTVTFGPGRYFLAGAIGNPGTVFSFANQVTLQDETPLVGGQSVDNTDAGEIFVFTDAYYPGLERPALVDAIAPNLGFGVADLQAGNNSASVINLHGLNRDATGLPAELKVFSPVALWQDQRNSTVRYTPQGNIDTSSCGAGHNLDNPCPGAATNGSPEMHLQATPNTFIRGAVYQPRGAWMTLQGSGVVSSALQLITGAIDVQGTPEVTLLGLQKPVMRKAVALVE